MNLINSSLNELHNLFDSLKVEYPIELPQIVVVGEQSSGKSSILESLVGREFLPKGTGMVTRRPLIVNIINDPAREYAEFAHISNRIFTNDSEIRNEIIHETDRTVDVTDISPQPILLKIHSHNIPNLTLVDLPGITKVATENQPRDIVKRIKDIILSYITPPTAIILVVVSAVVDLANSDALKYARSVDFHGVRTIGVITKIDLMSEGTDCFDILNNSLYSLKKGFVGVINRSKNDIDNNKSLESALDAEMEIFSTHPKYNQFGKRIGTRYLRQYLHQQLSNHIINQLPKLRDGFIEEMIKMKELIENDPHSNKEQCSSAALATKIFMIKVHEFASHIDCCFGYEHESINIHKLSNGTQISIILNQKFREEFLKYIPRPEIMKKEIQIGIQNVQGVRKDFFIGQATFGSITKGYLSKILQPCLNILKMVANEVYAMVKTITNDMFNEYPLLNQEIYNYLTAHLDNSYRSASDKIKFFVNIHVEHINTNHPDFIEEEKNSFQNERLVPSQDVIYKEGYMCIHGKKQGACYFMLKGEDLFQLNDEIKREIKKIFKLKDCVVKNVSNATRNMLFITQKHGQPIYQHSSSLELIYETPDAVKDWIKAFLQAGLEMGNSANSNSRNLGDLNVESNEMTQQVDYIFSLVERYLQLSLIQMQDIVSKICVLIIISSIRDSVRTDLVTHMFSIGDLTSYIIESDETVERRERNRLSYESFRKGINTINDVIRKLETLKIPQNYQNINNFNNLETYTQRQKSSITSPENSSVHSGHSRSPTVTLPKSNLSN